MFLETDVGVALTSEFKKNIYLQHLYHIVAKRGHVFLLKSCYNDMMELEPTLFWILQPDPLAWPFFSLRLVRCFICFSGKPCWYTCFPRFRNLKPHLPRIFAWTGARYHASRLQRSRRNPDVPEFSWPRSWTQENMCHTKVMYDQLGIF